MVARFILLALAVAEAVPGMSQAVLVARAVGPAEWRLESRPEGPPLRNLRLIEGQKIILIDAKGTREIEGPGELLLLSKGTADNVPLFALAFRAILSSSAGPTMRAGVRGSGDTGPKSDWKPINPR